MTEGINRTPLNLSDKQQNIRSHTAIHQVYWYHVVEVIKETAVFLSRDKKTKQTFHMSQCRQ
jgi:hypothetical protein